MELTVEALQRCLILGLVGDHWKGSEEVDHHRII